MAAEPEVLITSLLLQSYPHLRDLEQHLSTLRGMFHSHSLHRPVAKNRK